MDVNIDGVRTVDLTIEKRPQVSRMEIVDSGRRRRFSKEAKLAIVAESYSAPRQVIGSHTKGRLLPPPRKQLPEQRFRTLQAFIGQDQ